MKFFTAVDLRRSLARIARGLERTGEPVVLTLRGKLVGVLISVRDWNERAAAQERQRPISEILANRVPASEPSVDAVLAELRSR